MMQLLQLRHGRVRDGTGAEAGVKADAARERHFYFVLIPNFTMLAFATAIEPLRIANRMAGRAAYRWSLVSLDGEPAVASNGIRVGTDLSLKEARERVRGGERPDHVFVCGSLGVERFHDRALNSWIASLDRQKIGIGALDTGAWVLADAGVLEGRRCAIHWESLPAFAERFPEAEVYADLFEVDGNCYTCAGGTASLDLMLHLIGEHLDEQIVTKVCEQALTDRMRSPTDRQRLPLRARLGLQNTKLLFIIELMEANVAEPLSLVEIAKYARLSRRQIERLFRRNLGRSPARYYLEIRLDRARHLLIQSDAPIVEVAVACGFVSASHFSKCYRELYARSPQQERQGREKLLT
jgi:transcriptional regulator GlxA family with amidase domain